jgi:signal recognition particle receptor subunit beta
MVFLNYTTMQVTAKIVFYGPGLGGKTTNLQWIHQKTAPGSRGEMVSLETETDRTLFFDLLPLDVGVIGGMKVRLQLYTVPGQVFYNATRRLVLKGVDGVVFVADSQEAAEDANAESLNNLRSNLDELGLAADQIPVVFQYNKRDIQKILPVERMQELLNPGGAPAFEAAALHGVGVFETLKAISRLALESIRKKIAEDKKVPARAKAPPPTPAPAALKPPPAPEASRPAAAKPGEDLLAGLVVDEPGSGEVQVEFAEEDTDKHALRPVRTKGGIDIQSELEKLRAVAEHRPMPVTAVSDREVEGLMRRLSTQEKRREVRQKVSLEVPVDLLRASSAVRVHLAFDGEKGEEVVKDALTIGLAGSDTLERLMLFLDLDLKGKK